MSVERRARNVKRWAIGALFLVQSALLLSHSTHAQSTNGLSLTISGLSSPAGLALGPNQNLYVSDSALGNIYRIGPDGSIGVEASGFASPRDVVFDQGGSMYVADSAAGTVYRLDTNGQTMILANNLVSPCCLGFDKAGNLLVLHSSAGVSPVGHGPDEMAATGTVAPLYTGAITRIAPDGQQTLVATGFLNPQGVLVDKDNSILVAAEGYAGVASVVPRAVP